MYVGSIDGLHAVLGVSGPIYVLGGLELGPNGYVTTGQDSIVAARLEHIGQTIDEHIGEHETGPRFHIVMPNGSQFDNRSYTTELLRQSREVGITTKLWTPDTDEEALEIIAELSDENRSDVDGILPILQFNTIDGGDKARAIINRSRDVDGLAPAGERNVVPATASAMAIGAACLIGPKPSLLNRWRSIESLTERAYQRLGDSTIGVGGMGAMTTKPLVEHILKSDAIAADIAVTLNREDFENPESFDQFRACDVVFLAARRARYLKREHLKHGAVAVDVGNTPDEELGRSAGNLHESTWQTDNLEGLERFVPSLRPRTTAFDRCVGRISASIVLGRTTDNWLANRRARSDYMQAA